MIYLPFNSPLECEKIVREFGNRPGIVGFTICAVRHKPVHHNQYARLYAMIEETGKPLVFHAGPHWDDPSFTQLNRFISDARAVVRALQPDPHDQLDRQRDAGAFSED